MNKIKTKVGIITVLLFCVVGPSLSIADSSLIPALPHEFWGTVKDENGVNIQNGIIVKAVVDGETYQTTVVNGAYGFNKPYYPPNESDPSPFFVEDPENDNEGKTIYFYVDDINTSQTYEFVGGGVTRLDLVVPIDTPDNGGSGNTGGNTGGYVPPNNDIGEDNKLKPISDAKGPYRGRPNEIIIFYGSGSYDPDGQITNYSWDFGDNSTSYLKNPSHRYNTTGIFYVSLLVTDNDGLQDIDNTTATIFVDFDQDGWSDEEEEYYGTNSTNSTDYPIDTDGDYIPDEYDQDDDNDGLTDEIEISLNSDIKNYYDVKRIANEFGIFFFVDTNSDEIFDIYYDISSGFNSSLSTDDNVSYLVDVDGGGNWDYIYNSTSNAIKVYCPPKEKTNFNLYYIISIIIVLLITILIFYFKKGKKVNK